MFMKQPLSRTCPPAPDLAGISHPPRRCERRSGLTLIEILIYTVILVILTIPLVSVVLVATRAMAESDVINRLTERNRVILFRVAQDVRESMVGTPAIGGGGSTLTITLAAGVDATGVVPGHTIRYELVPEKGEAVNGGDDDGDGLADEGDLLRRDLTDGTLVPIASEISLADSSFTLNGTAVTVQISNFGRLRKAEDTFQVTRSVTANPRN